MPTFTMHLDVATLQFHNPTPSLFNHL